MPNHIADALGDSIGHPVHRASWDELFRSQTMRNPEPRVRMLDGFNESWIEFEDRGGKAIRGQTNAAAVIAALVADAAA
jgi:hypothetical protein